MPCFIKVCENILRTDVRHDARLGIAMPRATTLVPAAPGPALPAV